MGSFCYVLTYELVAQCIKIVEYIVYCIYKLLLIFVVASEWNKIIAISCRKAKMNKVTFLKEGFTPTRCTLSSSKRKFV
jgi:hypothetical protein